VLAGDCVPCHQLLLIRSEDIEYRQTDSLQFINYFRNQPAFPTSCHPKNEPLIATREEEEEEGVLPLQMNGVSTNSRLRQHLRGVGG